MAALFSPEILQAGAVKGLSWKMAASFRLLFCAGMSGAPSPSPVTFRYFTASRSVRATSVVLSKPTTGVFSNFGQLNDRTELFVTAKMGPEREREREDINTDLKKIFFNETERGEGNTNTDINKKEDRQTDRDRERTLTQIYFVVVVY